MASPTLTFDMPRRWFDIQKDGVGGEAGRIISTMSPYVNISPCNVSSQLICINYVDLSGQKSRCALGSDPEFNCANTGNINSFTNLQAYAGYNRTGSNFEWWIDGDVIFGQNGDLPLASINEVDQSNPSLQIVYDNTNPDTWYTLLSVGSGIYRVYGALYNLVVSDYSGQGFSSSVKVALNKSYLAYTTLTGVKVVTDTTYIEAPLDTFITIEGSYTNPSVVLLPNGNVYLFCESGNNIVGGQITQDGSYNPVVILRFIQGFKAYAFGNKISICAVIDITNTKLYNFKVDPSTMETSDLQCVSLYDYSIKTAKSFDYCYIENEEYISYIDTENVVHLAWNPVNKVKISVDQPIRSLNIVPDLTAGTFTPTFSPNVKDYMLPIQATQGLCNLTITVNGFITVKQLYVHQLLKFTDSTGASYYVKLSPNNTFPLAVQMQDAARYVPGYYATVQTFNGPFCPYYVIYDSNGTLVWYRRSTSNADLNNNPQLCSLQPGNGPNRLETLIFDTNRPRFLIDLQTMKEQAFLPKISPVEYPGFNPGWDVHETHEIRGPASRRGNVIFVSYQNGFYLQEQDTNNNVVWEFNSNDCFSSATAPGDWFHVNSVDVHPITGNVVLSMRNCHGIMSIEYDTKNIEWVIDSGSLMYPQALQNSYMANTKWLEIIDETFQAEVYAGTFFQHDARWHPEIPPLTAGNQIVSAYDNESANARTWARGVIYEIDLNLTKAIFRGSVKSTVGGTSGYMGSYRIQLEADGSNSHGVDWVQQHPSYVEYRGDAAMMPTQVELIRIDMPGDNYRICKMTPEMVSIKSMRKTSGMPYATPSL